MTKRILICGLTQIYGGMESYIMNIYRNIDREAFQFDFLMVGEPRLSCEEEVKSLGGNIYFLPLKREDYRKHYSVLDSVFSKNEYSGVYYQTGHMLQSLDVFKYAKRHGVKVRAIHSHNTRENEASLMVKIRRAFVYAELNKYVNHLLACSDEAGRWMFKGNEFEVIKNSIDTQAFSYSIEDRDSIRAELGLENKRIVGTVARFTKQKNPTFLLQIVDSLLKRNEDVVFFHLGTGDLEEEIRAEVEKRGLSDRYFFLGIKPDVNRYLSAMDVFVLPSLYEGFPISYVEAQCSGVKCIISDKITSESDLTNNSVFIPIDDSSKWVEQIERSFGYTRCDLSNVVKSKGYDINDTVNRIVDIFG